MILLRSKKAWNNNFYDKTKVTIKDDISIVLAGEAGQGVQSVELVLTRALKAEGYHIFASTEYMSRVRGGTNSTEIRVSADDRRAFLNRIDVFVPLDREALTHCDKRLTKDTVILGEKKMFDTDREMLDVPFIEMAREVGHRIFANTVAAGVILGMMGTGKEGAAKFLKAHFARKGKDIVDKNLTALDNGFTLGQKLAKENKISITCKKNEEVKDHIFLRGYDAVGLGALSGGVDFCTSYPMSPSTGVLTFLAQHGKERNVLVEQATDEIGAINMSLGAAYAGARCIVTTSGGGFALMTEGVSLAAIMEVPIVVHVAQRPGPATGLPTRTGQEDLNLVLYAGHGEFPRAIFAPGTLKQAHDLTAHAMNLTDKYQLPVFIVTDQYFVDTLSTVPLEDFEEQKVEKHIVKTDKDYKRYALTDDGVSPRGIPGNGEGYVAVDSDEHEEDGRITESEETRNAMQDKRIHKKLPRLIDEVVAPELIGPKDYDALVVCWGSTRHDVKEAVEICGNKKMAALHFSQVYPLHKDAKSMLEKAKTIAVVEGNEMGQFADLLTRETGVTGIEKITKSSGMQFSVEELTDKFKAL